MQHAATALHHYQNHNTQRDYYGLKLFLSLLILLILLASTSFYLIQNYYSKSFFDFSEKKALYFLNSDTLEYVYKLNGMDYQEYQKRIAYFKKLAQENHYEVKEVSADTLHSLAPDATLVALDMIALSQDEIEKINTFVTQGGHILFNFTSGFLDNKRKYQQKNLVQTLTPLRLDATINTIKLNPKSSSYISTRLASPLTHYLSQGFGLDLAVYDPIPIFDVNSTDVAADAYLTNWSQTNYIQLNTTTTLNAQQSTLVWHGTHGKGKWVYFSFPSYSFMEIKRKEFAQLLRGMLEYLTTNVQVTPYPYIDAKNVVFVSEDTEYKYENLKQFYQVSLKHKFPVTAFCVAELAAKHATLMHKVANSPYLEIGSHSYTHKKIVGESDAVYKKETLGSKKLLHKLTGKTITGFRPPREEIDKKLKKNLEEAGYHYILNEGENRLYPYFQDNILIIPRHATDDYSYLINLDWSAQEILANMKQELHTVVNLDGMYTLSTHTHLMIFRDNIKIVDQFFRYVNTQKTMHPMNGAMIFKRIKQRLSLSFKQEMTNKKIVLTIMNDNKENIHNMHYEITVDPSIRLTTLESEIIGLDAKLSQIAPHKYLLVVHDLKPKSHVMLFINYEKNTL